MLSVGCLQDAFQTYWDEMARCRTTSAYWALLHVTVCLPDICSALQSPNGEATRARYIEWCEKYLANPKLSGAERYRMRCKVLHQGRATTDLASSRYIGFSFGQPAANGQTDHLRDDAGCLNVDVTSLAEETKLAVVQWARNLEGNPGCTEAQHTERNLSSLVRVRQLAFPVAPSSPGGLPTFVTTLKTS